MSETELRNTDIDAALADAREAYVARNPKSLARFVEATAVMPGGNTRTVLHFAPFPLGIARGADHRMRMAVDPGGVFAEEVDVLGAVEIPQPAAGAARDAEREGREVQHRARVAAGHDGGRLDEPR